MKDWKQAQISKRRTRMRREQWMPACKARGSNRARPLIARTHQAHAQAEDSDQARRFPLAAACNCNER